MSLKQLKKHLLGQDYRATQISELPEENLPQFVKDKLAAFDRKQARRAAKEAKENAANVKA